MRKAPNADIAFRMNMQDVVRSFNEAALEVMLAGQKELPTLLRAELSKAGSGMLYRSRRNDGSMHRASKPGEPPAPDTGKYRASVFARGGLVGNGKYAIGVGSPEPYAELLETGGKNLSGNYVAARPHFSPVLSRWIAGRMRPMLQSRIVANERKTAAKGRIVVTSTGPTSGGGGRGMFSRAGSNIANRARGAASTFRNIFKWRR